MNVLIIGGTRNMGHYLSLKLHEAGHNVTILNRGISRNDLPDEIEFLKADRTIPAQLEQTIGKREFDVVVDFVVYSGVEAQVAVDLFHNRTGHYIFIGTGQVYLLRKGIQRPYAESDYSGDLIDEPPLNTYDYEEYTYGLYKRRAEDVLAKAHAEFQFPYTSLRLPMVNSIRDPFKRLYAYILRLKDQGPLLVPDKPDHRLRHVYADDVVRCIADLIENGKGKGKAYNISQEETLSLNDFLALLGAILGIEPTIIRVERSLLEANGFLPDCSPFSDVWMSELDNRLSKDELGMTYTPMRDYLEKIVNHYEENPPHQPISYRRRHAERHFAESYQAG